MSLTLLAIGFVALLVVAYRLYGGWVARQFRLDDGRRTPAHEVNDGVDFVPTKPFYLFGQHFSAIAAAGPIAGPILACQAFGWLPCLLWIGLGVVLIGAVHDFASLAASVRHGATSVAEITREHLGNKAGRAMMAFIWIALVYVIVAFADITAGTFVGGSEELRAAAVDFNPGGAVAAASVLYLLLSVVLGPRAEVLEPAAVARHGGLRPGGVRALVGGDADVHDLRDESQGVGRADTGLLLRGLDGAGVGALAAARLPRRVHPLRGHRARRLSASSSAATRSASPPSSRGTWAA